MKDELISFETAKLAKEKGFDNLVCYYAHGIAGIGEISSNTYKELESSGDLANGVLPIPTQSLLQKWLREEYDIHIFIKPMDTLTAGKQFVGEYGIGYPDKGIGCFNTYEEALEAGLVEALKLVKS